MESGASVTSSRWNRWVKGVLAARTPKLSLRIFGARTKHPTDPICPNSATNGELVTRWRKQAFAAKVDQFAKLLPLRVSLKTGR